MLDRQRDPDIVDPTRQIPQDFVLRLSEIRETIDGQKSYIRKGTTDIFSERGTSQPEPTFVVVPVLFGQVTLIAIIDQPEFQIAPGECGFSLLTRGNELLGPDFLALQPGRLVYVRHCLLHNSLLRMTATQR